MKATLDRSPMIFVLFRISLTCPTSKKDVVGFQSGDGSVRLKSGAPQEVTDSGNDLSRLLPNQCKGSDRH